MNCLWVHLVYLIKVRRAPVIEQSNDFTQASLGDLVSSWGLLAATWVSPKGLCHQKVTPSRI